MKQEAFELSHEEEWASFEAVLGQLGHGHRFGATVSTEDLPARYRRVCHHLALARERHYTAGLIRRLNELSLRGHHALYGVRPGLQRKCLRFMLAGFPRLVRTNWRPVLLAAALFYLPLCGLPFAIRKNPEVAYLIEDPQSLARMEEMYRSGNDKFGRKDASDTDVYMFGFYIWNNVRITFQIFASGLLLGVGSIFFLLINGLDGGAVAGHLTRMGLGQNFWSFVITHSALETTGLVLAGAAGMKLGFALLSPGCKSRLQSMKDAARNGIAIVYGAAFMVFLAAFFEAFWSSSALVPVAVKFGVGGTLWALVIAYFLFAGGAVFDRLGMAIRLRDPWEAVDLGFILLRAHWKAVMAAWLAVTVPVSVLLYVLFRGHLWVPPLVIWWLNPALDRVVLHVLAKAAFGEIPGLLETLKHSPRLLRRGFVASLIWRRLSTQRSFVLPVWQLEEQPGDGFRKRCNVLLRRGRTQAVFLTTVCFLFHFVVFSSALAGLALFTPKGIDFNVMDAVFGSGSERIRWVDIFLSLLPIISITLLEPFYVAGGFALYLNRRVELEGWDLEVNFRKIAARITKVLGRGVAVLLLLGFLAFPTTLMAARPEPREALAEVLKQPEFQVKQKKKGLHWKDQDRKETPRNTSLPSGFLEFFKFLAVIAKWFIIAAAAATMAYVVWRNRRYLTRRLKITSEEALPETLFGMDIRPEALPSGLAEVAVRLWAEGRIRAALALLYRGALAQLVHRHRIPLSKGATEGDCLRKAREILPRPSADYFGRLTRIWLQVAYADLAPDPGSETLCTEWSLHFRETPDEVRR